MRVIAFMPLLAAFFFAIPAHAWNGAVLSVADGDTVTVGINGNPEMPVIIRLYGIDAPEMDQPHGKEARARMEELAPPGKTLEIILLDLNKHGRAMGLLMDGNTCVNRVMLDDGLAWTYTRDCREKFCRTWKKAQDRARNAKKGLWNDENPTPPWKWRQERNGR